MNVASIEASLGLDINNFTRGFATAEKSVGGFVSRMERAEAGSKLFAGGLAILGGGLVLAGKKAIEMGMSAVESENLFDVSMGKMSGAARAWSKDLSQSLGINQYELRKNTGMLDAMAKSMGLSETQAYGVSTGLSKLSYDMASFYNLKPEIAFEKLRSGISGEIEPLKQLGILVNENTVQAYAYTHGIAEQGAKLTEQQKVMARYGAIMEQTKMAQGDLARTIESPTNRIRVMTEKINELGVSIGTALLPAFEKILTVAAPVIDNLAQKLTSFFQTLNAEGLQGAFEKLFPPDVQEKVFIVAGAIMGALVPALYALASGFIAAMAPIAPFLAIGAAVGALAFLIYKNWDKVGPFFKDLWEGIQEVAMRVWNALGPALKSIWDNLTKTAQVIFNNFKVFWDAHGKQIMAIAKVAWDLIGTQIVAAIKVIAGVINTVLALMRGDWSGAWESMKGVAKAVWEGINSIVGSLAKALAIVISAVVTSIQSALLAKWTQIKTDALDSWNAIKSGATSKVGELKSAVVSGLESIWSYIQSIPSKAVGWGASIIKAIVRGVKSIHIPLPHFSVSYSAGPMGMKLPGLGVNWYGEGGIFDGPSIIGVGERGPEAVVPLNGRNGLGTTNIYVTGNTISSQMDIDRIGDEIVKRLRRKGVKL